jgi:hypothetical protein
MVPMGFLETAPVAALGEMAPEFEAFWKAYPRRLGKGQARIAYARARRLASAEDILAGAQRYAHECEIRNEPRYTCHPTTWLNGERWTDEYEAPKGVNGHGPQHTASNGYGNGAYRNGQAAGGQRSRADALLAAGVAAGARVGAHNRNGRS